MTDAAASGPDEEAPDTSTQDDAPADGTVEDHPDWVDNLKLGAIRDVKEQIEKSRTFLVEDWTTSTQTVPSATDPDGLNPTVVVGGAGPDSFRTALDEETWNSAPPWSISPGSTPPSTRSPLCSMPSSLS